MVKRLVDISTISSDKTVVPKPIRTMYNLNDGDIIEWHENGEKEIIIKKEEKK